MIPTANAAGPLARRALDFYDPLPVVIVESSGRFFNYSASLNVGIDEALRLGPDWIIMSNDDIIPIDPLDKLVEQVRANPDADQLLIRPSASRAFWQHSALIEICTHSSLREAIWRIPWSIATGTVEATLMALLFEERYDAMFALAPVTDDPERKGIETQISKKLLYQAKEKFYPNRSQSIRLRSFADFGVFKSSVLETRRFDETYINGYEDTDLTLDLISSGVMSAMVDFELGHRRGASLSPSSKAESTRIMHEVLNKIYFFRKNDDRIRSFLNGDQSVDL